jgi:hypothetical protein
MKTLSTFSVHAGKVFSFWSENVRKNEKSFNPGDPASKKLIASMSAKLIDEDGVRIYSGGGYNSTIGGNLTVVPMTSEEKERARTMILAEMEQMAQEASRNGANTVTSVARLQAEKARWGDDPRPEWKVITGNRRAHSITLALAHSIMDAEKNGIVPKDGVSACQQVIDQFNMEFTVTHVEFASQEEKVLLQIEENSKKTEGFSQLTWQDFFLSVMPMIEAGKITNTGVRNAWPGGTTYGQRAWHLTKIHCTYPIMDIPDRLIPNPSNPKQLEERLAWEKMDHNVLTKLSKQCNPRELEAENAKRARENQPLLPFLDVPAMETELQILQSGVVKKKIAPKSLETLTTCTNPFVKATADYVKTGDRSELDKLDDLGKATNFLCNIYQLLAPLGTDSSKTALENFFKALVQQGSKDPQALYDFFAAGPVFKAEPVAEPAAEPAAKSKKK